MTNTINKQWLLENILLENWQVVCGHIRDWYAYNCPLYRKDEVEGTIGSWVGRMAIIKRQIETGNQPVWESTGIGTTKARPMTAEECGQEIREEIDIKWDDALRLYNTQMDRINNHPVAEKHVMEILARLEKQKVSN